MEWTYSESSSEIRLNRTRHGYPRVEAHSSKRWKGVIPAHTCRCIWQLLTGEEKYGDSVGDEGLLQSPFVEDQREWFCRRQNNPKGFGSEGRNLRMNN